VLSEPRFGTVPNLPEELVVPKGRTYRILGVTWRGETAVEKGFRDYLARRGVSVQYFWRDANRDKGRLEEIVREIPSLKPDLIYTWGTSTTLGIVGPYNDPIPETASIPTVFALVADPVGAHIIPNLEKPGRPVTGVSHMAPIEAQVEAMYSYRPFQRIGVLYNKAEANSVLTAEGLRAVAAARGFSVTEQVFDTSEDNTPNTNRLKEKMDAFKRAGAEWLYVGPDSFLTTQIKQVAAAAREAGLPLFATTEAVIDAREDVLAGLVSPYRSVGEFAAYKAIQILVEGKKASSVPAETLKRFSLVVRMDVAKKLNLLPPLAMFDFAEMREAQPAH